MKTCRRCGEFTSDFPPMLKCLDGLSSWCRDCHRAGARESYQARRETVLANDKARREKDRPMREAARALRLAERAAAKMESVVGSSCAVRYGSCTECAAPFVHGFRTGGKQKYCSTSCAHRVQNRKRPIRPVLVQTCEECLTSYSGTSGRRFCSGECSRRFHATHARHRSRAAARVSVERISRVVVFERDEWICGICGQYVDRDTPGTDMLGPTLDHIFPLVKGGEHTYANIQLAHRLCNIAKGGRVAA